MREVYPNELYHYGIKGMRWGVRRYENPDGTLTEAGKKRYSNGEKAYKKFKRRVRRQRGKVHGGSNRWMHDLNIGPNSKAVMEQQKANRHDYENTPEYKKWKATNDKLYRDVDRAFNSGDMKKYNAALAKAESHYETRPKSKNDLPWGATVFGKDRKYYDSSGNDNYINTGGKQLTTAYLQDLGLNRATAEKIAESMIKKKRSLGDI